MKNIKLGLQEGKECIHYEKLPNTKWLQTTLKTKFPISRGEAKQRLNTDKWRWNGDLSRLLQRSCPCSLGGLHKATSNPVIL